MNMNVLSKHNIGEIMAGYYPVPQNPIAVGLAGIGRCGGGCSKPRPTLNGLGQNCPSMQQLQGIVDASDPCQAGSFQTTGVATCPTGSSPSFTQGSSSGGFVCVPDSTTVTTNTVTAPVTAAPTTIAGIPTNYLIMGAIALGVLALVKK